MPTNPVTEILTRIEQGDPAAAEALLPLVYDELRKLAAGHLSRESSQTLEATALVHEAYLRLVDHSVPQEWNGRGHFFGAAAEAMRRILVENARRKRALKRGGDARQVPLAEQIATPEPDVDLVELNDVLDLLADHDRRKAELVKLRYFAGLTIRQAAEVLNIAESTADADWAYAKSWLKLRLKERT